MSETRTRKTRRGTVSDGTVVEVTNSAPYDVYSWRKLGSGKWVQVCRGSSRNSVRSRSITALGSHDFEIVYMREAMPEVIEKYLAAYPLPPLPGQRFVIQEVFINGRWVSEIPPTEINPQPEKIHVRPTRSFCRKLAVQYGVKAIAAGYPCLPADFQVSEMGFRMPKPPRAVNCHNCNHPTSHQDWCGTKNVNLLATPEAVNQ